MNSVLKTAALAAFAAACAAAPASAAISTWTFTGECTFGSCSDNASATLVLSDYTFGEALDPAKFVSFSYTSDTQSFSFDASHLSWILGSLGGFAFSPGRYSVDLGGTVGDSELWMASNGFDGVSWNSNNVDGGKPFVWTTEDAPTDGDPTGDVPEPASWAMMLGGFGLVGSAMRRRRVAVRFA